MHNISQFAHDIEASAAIASELRKPQTAVNRELLIETHESIWSRIEKAWSGMSPEQISVMSKQVSDEIRQLKQLRLVRIMRKKAAKERKHELFYGMA